MILVLVREILDLDSIFCKFCKLQQTLLELPGFLSIFLDLLVLLFVHDFILEPSFHDALPDFLDAFNE